MGRPNKFGEGSDTQCFTRSKWMREKIRSRRDELGVDTDSDAVRSDLLYSWTIQAREADAALRRYEVRAQLSELIGSLAGKYSEAA